MNKSFNKVGFHVLPPCYKLWRDEFLLNVVHLERALHAWHGELEQVNQTVKQMDKRNSCEEDGEDTALCLVYV